MNAETKIGTEGVPAHVWQGDIAGVDHTVIQVPDLEQGIDWYRRLFGFVEAERRPDRVYFASPRTGRIVFGLSQGKVGLDYVSYRVRGAGSLARITARLDDAGIPYESGIEGTRSGAIEAIRVRLPSGHVMEVLHAEPDGKAAPVPDYRAGGWDVRTSHWQLRTLDVDEASAFLQVLGFKISTFVPGPNGKTMFQFLRVNDFHHQLAILTGRPGFHHVALELDTADFWKICDHLAIERIPAEYGPGRHLEGGLLFLYVRDPFGNRTEITGPMGYVGFNYPVEPASDDEGWYHMNMWGPQPPESWYTEWMCDGELVKSELPRH